MPNSFETTPHHSEKQALIPVEYIGPLASVFFTLNSVQPPHTVAAEMDLRHKTSELADDEEGEKKFISTSRKKKEKQNSLGHYYQKALETHIDSLRYYLPLKEDRFNYTNEGLNLKKKRDQEKRQRTKQRKLDAKEKKGLGKKPHHSRQSRQSRIQNDWAEYAA